MQIDVDNRGKGKTTSLIMDRLFHRNTYHYHNS